MPTRIKLPTSLTAATTSVTDCKPCQAARAQALAAAEQIVARPATTSSITWSGPIVHENLMTGDGRFIESNALTWENLPIPLRWVKEDTGEHNGAMVVGRITAIERQPGGVIFAHGDFDTGSPEGIEAARQVREDLSRGVSVDMDNVSFTIRVAKELLPDPEEIETEPATEEADDDGRVTVLDIDADAEVMVIDDARIRAATLVAVPAFEGARIALDEDQADPAGAAPEDTDDSVNRGLTPDGDPCSCDQDADDFDPDCNCDTQPEEPVEDELTAAGIPAQPPGDWFKDPLLTEPMPLTVFDNGYVVGHLATWETCHTAFARECVTPPRSASAYGYFRTGTVLTENGEEVPVGHITLDTFHAGKSLGAADTVAHYEHTGATVADVAAGEDEHGIWVAGALRPTVTDDQLRALRSAPLSGDWRRIGGNLELVAALAVNVPGFPVPRTQGRLAASGAVQTLVASGVVHPDRYNRGGVLPGKSSGPHIRFTVDSPYLTRDDISDDALAWLRKMTAPQHNKAQAAALRRKVAAARIARRVQKVR